MQLHNGSEHFGNVIKHGCRKCGCCETSALHLRNVTKLCMFYCRGLAKRWQQSSTAKERGGGWPGLKAHVDRCLLTL